MLLKATFPSSYLGLVEATSAAIKKWVFSGTACYQFLSVKDTPLTQQYIIYSTPFRRRPTFLWPLMSLRPARDMSLGRWLLVACFSSVKNHNVSGPLLFFQVSPHAKKKPFATPRTVLQRTWFDSGLSPRTLFIDTFASAVREIVAKNSLCNRLQFRTLFLPHRFIKIRPSHQRPRPTRQH